MNDFGLKVSLQPERACRMMDRAQPDSVNTLLEGAGIFIWPLGVCSLLVVFLVLERALALMPGKVAPAAVLKLVHEGRAKELNSESAHSAAGRLVLRWKEGAAGEVLKAYARAELVRLQRGFFLIDSIVAAAPLLGLLGTVTGLATLFPEHGLPDSQTLTRGVGLALSTTMIGLCIAIPALLAANWLSRRVEVLSSRLDVLVEGLERNPR
jgi:biopolymer transport protein ExbB